MKKVYPKCTCCGVRKRGNTPYKFHGKCLKCWNNYCALMDLIW